jgi:hypothetical protein
MSSELNGQSDPVMRAVVFHWLNKLERARADKRRKFDEEADRCRHFYHGPRSWRSLMASHGVGGYVGDSVPDPWFQMSVNKAFELVSIYGPALYYNNPVRTVSPRAPRMVDPRFAGDPYVYQALVGGEQQQLERDTVIAGEVGAYLDWTPVENHLDQHSRRAIEESLITGRGCLWTELVQPPGCSFRVVASLYDSVDNLLVDPDAETLEEATWIARRCIHPVWQVERDYGLPRGSLRGNMESMAVQAEIDLGYDGNDDRQFDRRRGWTNDLLSYWKIYSRMGIGGRLSGIDQRFRGPLEMFGDFCFLVVARDVTFPLNLPPAAQQAPGFGGEGNDAMARVSWPTPYWPRGWPVSCLDFHKLPHTQWPMAHLQSGMGELKFLNWAMSFLAGRMRHSCRTFVAVKKSAPEEMKTAILNGRDLTMLEVEEQYQDVKEIVQFLDHPDVNSDIWKVIAAVEENFDKRTGLYELMYGNQGGTQIRSSYEAQVRSSNMNVRPDDMAKQVEAWMTEVAIKEGMCARWHLTALDIAPVMGTGAAAIWQSLVRTRDLNVLARQLEYRIEAGSARKPNRDTQMAQSDEGIKMLLPIFQQYATATLNFGPMNALIGDWCRARDLDPNRYMLEAPAMPAAGPPPPSGFPAQAPANMAPPPVS